MNVTTKQQYLPAGNILQTRYLHEDGVMNLLDFFPRPSVKTLVSQVGPDGAVKATGRATENRSMLKKWLVRRVECIRGSIDVDVEVFPVTIAPFQSLLCTSLLTPFSVRPSTMRKTSIPPR